MMPKRIPTVDPPETRPAVGYDRRLSYGSRVLYMQLQDVADATGFCCPSYGDLARELGTSRQSVMRMVRGLVDAGHLQALAEMDGGRYVRTRYRLLSPLNRSESAKMREQESTAVLPKRQHGVLSKRQHVVPPRQHAVLPKRQHAASQKVTPPSLPEIPVLSSSPEIRVDTTGTSGPDIPVAAATPSNPGTSRKRTDRTTSGPANAPKAKPRVSENPAAPLAKPSATPNRIAQVIDAMTALGYQLTVDYHLNGRDHRAIKASTASPELLAQGYVALKTGTWDDPFLHSRLAMYVVAENINAFLEQRDGIAGQRAKPSVSRRRAPFEPAGEIPAFLTRPPHSDYTF